MTTYLGKICSFGLPRVPFVNCRQFLYLVISLLVLRAGCGIWLYQFLIIAYLFTSSIVPCNKYIFDQDMFGSVSICDVLTSCTRSFYSPWYKTEISRTDENRGKPCRVCKNLFIFTAAGANCLLVSLKCFPVLQLVQLPAHSGLFRIYNTAERSAGRHGLLLLMNRLSKTEPGKCIFIVYCVI